MLTSANAGTIPLDRTTATIEIEEALTAGLVSKRVSDARYNWLPEVHRQFGEQLYFVLFRFLQTQKVADQIELIMARAGIEHFSSYTMLGYYDGLVRFWATPRDYASLIRLTKDATVGVSVERTLLASSIWYTWNSAGDAWDVDLLGSDGTVSDSDVITMKRHEIRAVAQNSTVEAVSPETIQTMASLAERGLLLIKPAEADATIKVFILLQPFAELRDLSQITKNLLALRRQGGSFLTMSIYAGEGSLCTHLIRLTASSYGEILELTRSIDSAISMFQFRSTTLFVGSEEVFETDNINNIERLTADEQQVAARLAIDQAVVGGLSPESRNWLLSNYNKIAGFADDKRSIDLAVRILTAAVCQNREDLRGALSFIVDLEYYFRTFVIGAFEEAFKHGWIAEVQKRYPNPFKNLVNNKTDLDNPDRWPLGVVLQLLREAMAAKDSKPNENEYIGGVVASVLGADWYGTVRPVFDLRNEFAHGRLLNKQRQLNDFSGDWGRQLSQILDVLPLHSRLYSNINFSYLSEGKE